MAKKSGGGAALFVIIGVLALLAAVPKEVWVGLAGALLVGVSVYLFVKDKKKNGAQQPGLTKTSSHLEPDSDPMTWYPTRIDEPVSVAAATASPQGHKIPTASPESAHWVAHDDEVRIAGFIIPGGMFYMGNGLKAPNGQREVSLVPPTLPVAAYDVPYKRELPWTPSYWQMHPDQRRTYLEWLSGGRLDPFIPVGYLFLFLSGLERRVRVDARKDSAHVAEATRDLPRIANELRRLLALYGRFRPFVRPALSLLDLIELVQASDPLYVRPPPQFPATGHIPAYIRLALGQCVLDKVPVPPSLALAWAKTDPGFYSSAPGQRFPQLLDALFVYRYGQVFKEGMLVRTRTSTRVSFKYELVNRALDADVDATFEAPDVSGLVTPLRKLRDVAQEATHLLSPYSRLALKFEERAAALDGLLLLPVGVWPESARQSMAAMELRTRIGPFVITVRDLVLHFGSLHLLNKASMLGLQAALASGGVAMEPDIAATGRSPDIDDPLVLFPAVPEDTPEARDTPLYKGALLTLQLGAVVAMADGTMNQPELQVMDSQIGRWDVLPSASQKRLRAHLLLLSVAAPTLTGLRTRLNALPLPARESLGVFSATIAQVDGEASPDEIKVLEKVYKVLALDAQRLYSELHATASQLRTSTRPLGAPAQPGFGNELPGELQLDHARIAELHEDTNRVSALLANIFVDDEHPAPAKPAPPADATDASSAPQAHAAAPLGLVALDAAHAAFVTSLLARAQWSRAELLNLAATFELMLDGALEQVNDTSFDVHDMPLTEGDDPVTVNQELLEKHSQ